MPRRFRLFAVIGALLVAAGSAAVASASSDSHAELCYRFQNTPVKNNRYVVQNNVWGATTDQCLEVGSDGSFRVTGSEHRNDDTAAAYPSVYTGCHWGHCARRTTLPLRVNEIKSARSSWRVSTDAPGMWIATYDLWYHTSSEINRSPDGAEVMIWLDHTGGVNPNGKIVARNVRLAGSLWDVWYGDVAWNYVAYVRTQPTSSVRNLDLKAFTGDAMARGYIKPSWYLSGVEAGFEIWRDGTGLASKSFSVTVERGAATPTSGPVLPAAGAGTPADRAPCEARWKSSNWETGLVADISVVNRGAPLNGWAVEWTFRSDERVDGTGWGTELSQTGKRVTARNAPYNATLGTGGTVDFGFQAKHGGSPKKPTSITLNGMKCALR